MTINKPLKQTALHEKHLEHGARMVNFGGWELPLHYGSQIEEHRRVRRDAGVFDVSHMTIIDITGAGARAYLRHLLAAEIDAMSMPGRALYSCMLNPRGGVIDDVIVYYTGQDRYRVVANAATRDRVLAWTTELARDHSVKPKVADDLAMLAVQGPAARARLVAQLDRDTSPIAERLGYFHVAEIGETWIARTGYTGEDGFEVLLPAAAAPALWQRLVDAGAAPAGLGARDSLRLEAGPNLYGAEMNEDITPLQCGLAWTISWQPERDFVGRRALTQEREAGVTRKRIGLVVERRGVPRAQQKVLFETGEEGEVTSGGFSPTLGVPIALARVPITAGECCEVESRGQRLPARVVRPPFVRNGKACIPTASRAQPTPVGPSS
ncbi:MAG: glycine cleavage system aminomethyltransferase GcvT [Gammaproteobacteria bacterium]